jgi:magnesium transporter
MEGELSPERADEGKADRVITVIGYDEASFHEETVPDITAALDIIGRRPVTWIIVNGHLNEEEMAVLEDRLGVHPVVSREMAAHPPGRPKVIDLENLVFVSWRVMERRRDRLSMGQVSNLLGRGFLITQCPVGCTFRKVRENIRGNKTRLRRMGPDYLLYSVVDVIIDDYFSVSEEMGELIEDVQDSILSYGRKESLVEVQKLRRMLISFRQSIWPLRESLNQLVKGESDLIDDYTSPYFREVYDHTIELMDTVDTHRDMLSEMIDVYQTNVSNQLNEVVKVLTLISVIFAPLTFIVGLFGMNFRYMPELLSPWGYPAVLLVMIFVALVMVLLFRRRGWFRSS